MPAKWPAFSAVADSRDVPILLPDLGVGDQPVRLGQWLVESGDHVMEHDRVLEVLVSGILFHVASPAEGTLRRAIGHEGARLSAGETLGYIDTSE
jgi:pyruvate/2-oxoglutarate dehydrogenase complex dihydrolipoamide acyltransferase (E2) component